jgi:hypothetical protein
MLQVQSQCYLIETMLNDILYFPVNKLLILKVLPHIFCEGVTHYSSMNYGWEKGRKQQWSTLKVNQGKPWCSSH